MFEIIFIIIIAAFVIGGIWAYVVSKKVKKEGIETDAVVSRIELREWNDWSGDAYAPSVTEDYYITYTDREGNSVESLLSNPGNNKLKKGDRIKIKYLPDRKEYPVMVKTL